MANYTLFISPSMLRRVSTCHTRAALASLGYTSHEPAPQLAVGKAFHVGLATYLTPAEKCCTAFRREYGDALSRGELGTLGDTFTLNQELEPEFTLDNVEAIFGEWLTRNQTLPFTVSRVEVPFEVEFCTLQIGSDTVKVVLIGVWDGVGTELAQPILVEHKTTRKRLDARYKRLYRTDPQIGTYIYAYKKKYGVEVSGVWVNAIQIREVPTSLRKCSKHKVLYKECGPEHLTMALFKVDRTSEQMVDWEEETKALCAEYFAICQRRKFPQDDLRVERIQGEFNGGCEYCFAADYCATGRQNLDVLGKHELEEGSLRSRLEVNE